MLVGKEVRIGGEKTEDNYLILDAGFVKGFINRFFKRTPENV
jgi:hypothetical protein